MNLKAWVREKKRISYKNFDCSEFPVKREGYEKAEDLDELRSIIVGKFEEWIEEYGTPKQIYIKDNNFTFYWDDVGLNIVSQGVLCGHNNNRDIYNEFNKSVEEELYKIAKGYRQEWIDTVEKLGLGIGYEFCMNESPYHYDNEKYRVTLNGFEGFVYRNDWKLVEDERAGQIIYGLLLGKRFITWKYSPEQIEAFKKQEEEERLKAEEKKKAKKRKRKRYGEDDD